MSRSTRRLALAAALLLILAGIAVLGRADVRSADTAQSTAAPTGTRLPPVGPVAPSAGGGAAAMPAAAAPTPVAEDDRALAEALADPALPDGGAHAVMAAAATEATELEGTLTSAAAAVPPAAAPSGTRSAGQPATGSQPFFRGTRPIDADELRDRQRPPHKQPLRTPLGAG